MSKPLTIGALSRDSGVNLETIRFYERSGLLPAPKRSASGYRHYESVDVRRLRFIRRGRELGFSLEEIRSLLDLAAHPEQPCDTADRMAREHLLAVEARIRDLQNMQAELHKLAACHSGHAEHCRLLEALADKDCCLPGQQEGG
ncbi:MerR family DNA-binding protein [Pseudomonas sp. LRF_L74]|uniref:MerR family DNA-binding protein n=1 Tax=Pseudomonas sp. LRF_L74 TaxID=3369422 RepID=UPI003F643220